MLVPALVGKARIGGLIKHAHRSRSASMFHLNEQHSARLERQIPIAK